MSFRSVVFDAVEGIAALYDFVRRFRSPAPIPLTRPLSHKAVEHQQAQIRQATIHPPPPPSTRYQ